jgi:hypothetical protein
MVVESQLVQEWMERNAVQRAKFNEISTIDRWIGEYVHGLYCFFAVYSAQLFVSTPACLAHGEKDGL